MCGGEGLQGKTRQNHLLRAKGLLILEFLLGCSQFVISPTVLTLYPCMTRLAHHFNTLRTNIFPLVGFLVRSWLVLPSFFTPWTRMQREIQVIQPIAHTTYLRPDCFFLPNISLDLVLSSTITTLCHECAEAAAFTSRNAQSASTGSSSVVKSDATAVAKSCCLRIFLVLYWCISCYQGCHQRIFLSCSSCCRRCY
jgi:hypothetical protein